MNDVGKPERETQRRVIALFRDELDYCFLGDWTDPEQYGKSANSNIEEKLLTDYLRDKGGYSPAQINAAIYKLTTEANNSNRGLYGNNHAVYNLLRYGVPVKVEAGKPTETVHLINWQRAIARQIETLTQSLFASVQPLENERNKRLTGRGHFKCFVSDWTTLLSHGQHCIVSY